MESQVSYLVSNVFLRSNVLMKSRDVTFTRLFVCLDEFTQFKRGAEDLDFHVDHRVELCFLADSDECQVEIIAK